MSSGDVRDIISVQVGIHRDPGLIKLEVILRARQRRKTKKLEQINGQFLLNDTDVVHYRLRRIVRESQNVAAAGQHPSLLPGQQHFSILGDFILLLLGADEGVRIYILKSDENSPNARPRRFFNKVRETMAQRVHLNNELQLE